MDLSESVILDIKRTFKSDKEAEDYLLGLGHVNKPSEDEIDRIIRIELADFKSLGKDVLRSVLEKNNWSYVECFETLISLAEQKEWQQKRAQNILDNLTQKLTPSEIQRVIEENDGDIERTANELLQKGRDEEEKRRDDILETLVARFRDVKVHLILKFLQEENWEVQTTVYKIVKERRENLVKVLLNEYPKATKDQIYYSIEANDNETFDKTRANIAKLLEDQNSSEAKPDELLEKSRVNEVVTMIEKDITEERDKGIDNNFNAIFNDFIRNDAKLVPGNVTQEEPKPEEKNTFTSSLFLSTILRPTELQESPVVEGIEKIFLEPNQDGSKQIIKLEVPERVDFGEKIVINWSHTGTPCENDWVAMYPHGSNGKDYFTYQWVIPGQEREPFVFDAPYSAASDFYFVYYSNRTYKSCAESAVVKIGPKYDIEVLSCLENKNNSVSLYSATLRVTQEGGKEQPNLWIALYSKTEKYIKNFVSYQYCSINKDIIFNIPKSGSWVFKLFPFKSYEPILTVPYFIDGEDKVSLQLVGTQFVIQYHIKTLSFENSRQLPWVGVYLSIEEDSKQWQRYKYCNSFTGALTIDGNNLQPGKYEVRLLDYVTSAVVAKSEVVVLGD